MISVDEALQAVLARAGRRPPVTVPLAHALGLVLAEKVASDVDSPPHDKAVVDGYAVRAADVAGGEATLAVLEEVVAGSLPAMPLAPATATRVMTGAPVPVGADAVVMVERTRLLSTTNGASPRVHVSGQVTSGQNVLRRGASMRTGDVVLAEGQLLRPIEIGLLSEVGRTRVRAVPRPSVAVLATGNELVPPGQVPSAGEIRNSNGPMLLAAVARGGGVGLDLGIGRDEPESLARLIRAGLSADVLVLSGGVSAGVLDLVPGLLAEADVEQVFHRVNLKPGKPLWFGVRRDEPLDKLVFGLPGNPVSSLVCFELFVRPAMARLAGRPANGLGRTSARLAARFVQRSDRPTWHPAFHRPEDGQVAPLVWQGSADLRALAGANALAHFPAGERTFEADESVEVYLLE